MIVHNSDDCRLTEDNRNHWFPRSARDYVQVPVPIHVLPVYTVVEPVAIIVRSDGEGALWRLRW